MSEYNHGRMREWMEKESEVKDQYSRKAYFLVNWQELSVIQCCYDDTQTPNTVWIRRAWFAPKATGLSYYDVSEYEEIEKDDAERR